MWKAMNGLKYVAPLSEIVKDPDSFSVAATNDTIELRPFYYLYPNDAQYVSGTCLELSYYLAHRLKAMIDSGQLHQDYRFYVVEGSCEPYFSEDGADHYFALGTKSHPKTDEPAEVLDFLRGEFTNGSTLYLLDPTFKRVGILNDHHSSRYQLRDLLYCTNTLPNIQRDFSLLKAKPDYSFTPSIALGLVEQLIPANLIPEDLTSKHFVYLGFRRTQSEGGTVWQPSLAVQSPTEKAIWVWSDQEHVLNTLPDENSLKQFMRLLKSKI